MGPIAFAQMALSYPTGRFHGKPTRLGLRVRPGIRSAGGPERLQHAVSSTLSACSVCPPPKVPDVDPRLGDPPIPLQRWNDFWLGVRDGDPADRPSRPLPGVRSREHGRPPVARAGAPYGVVSHVHLVGDRLRRADGPISVLTSISWLQTAGALAAALTALLGLAVTWTVRGPVGDLVVELETVGAGQRSRRACPLARGSDARAGALAS